MSIKLPTISWEVIISNTSVVSGEDYRYNCTLQPININDPGYGQLDVGYYIVDFIGHIFQIEEVNGYDIKVYDLLEDTQYTGPYNDKNGYVYSSLKEAALVAQAKLNRLDKSAEDFIRNLILENKNTFTYLDDTPNSYLGHANKVPSVSDDETGLEFVDFSTEYLVVNTFQTAHGFTNDFVYHNGLNWVKAQANSGETCATHYAIRIDDDNFKLIPVGELDLGSLTDENGDPLVVGEYYFLSQTNAGKITGTKPTDGIIQSVLKSNSTSRITVSIQEPYDISDTSGGSGSSTSFIGLDDTPSSYTADKWLKVNSSANGIEWVDAPSGSGTVTNVTSSTLNQLTVTNGTTTPELAIVTGAVQNGGTSLATGDQIYDFVIGLNYTSNTGTVTSVSAGAGMQFTTINNTGTVTLGTPSTLTSETSNSVTSTSHTHNIEIANQVSISSDTTPNPTGNYKENEYYLTALAGNATFAAPSGTANNGNTLLIRVKDNGTSRTLSWNSIYRAIGVTLPTSTTVGKTLYIGCIYNSSDSKWDVVSIVEQA